MAKNKKQSTSRKTVTKKTTSVAKSAQPEVQIQEKGNSIWIPLLSVLAVIVFGIIAYRWLIVAQVNGQIIDRLEYYKELRRAAGKQVVEDMITRRLMKQALAEKKIVITDKEIDEEIAKVEKQLKPRGETLDSLLKQQGATRKDLRENIMLNKGFEKYFANKVTVTDNEIKSYIEQNETMFQEGTSEKDKYDQAKQLLRTRKLTAEYQKWQEEARAKAKIVIVAQ